MVISSGFSLPHLTRRLNVAGRDVTRYLIKLLLFRGYVFNRTADFETVRQIKEKVISILQPFVLSLFVMIMATSGGHSWGCTTPIKLC